MPVVPDHERVEVVLRVNVEFAVHFFHAQLFTFGRGKFALVYYTENILLLYASVALLGIFILLRD